MAGQVVERRETRIAELIALQMIVYNDVSGWKVGTKAFCVDTRNVRWKRSTIIVRVMEISREFRHLLTQVSQVRVQLSL